MTRSKAWYAYYPGDIDSDTADLSVAEFGMYQRLLNYHFKNDSIPTDPRRIGRIVGASSSMVRVCLPILLPYFYEMDGRLYQKRMVKEIAKATDKYEQRVTAGRKGGLAKARANATAKATAKAYQSQSQLHKELKEGAALPPVDQGKKAKPSDPKAEMFRLWVSVCTVAGTSEKAARSFLGKQLRDHPEKAVYAAVGVTCSESRSDPVSFLAGQLKANPKTGAKVASELAMVIPDYKFMKWAAGQGFASDSFPAGMGSDECRQWLSRKLKNQEREQAA